MSNKAITHCYAMILKHGDSLRLNDCLSIYRLDNPEFSFTIKSKLTLKLTLIQHEV